MDYNRKESQSSSCTLSYKEELPNKQQKDATLCDSELDSSTLTSSTSTSSLIRKSEKLISSSSDARIIILKLPKVLNDALNIRLNFDPKHNQFTKHKIRKASTSQDTIKKKQTQQSSQEFIEIDISNLSDILDAKKLREQEEKYLEKDKIDKTTTQTKTTTTSTKETLTKSENLNIKKMNEQILTSSRTTGSHQLATSQATGTQQLATSQAITSTATSRQQYSEMRTAASTSTSSSYKQSSASSENNGQFNVNNLLSLDKLPKPSALSPNILSPINSSSTIGFKDLETSSHKQQSYVDNTNSKKDSVLQAVSFGSNEPKVSSGSFSTSFYDDSKKGVEQGGSLHASNYAAEYSNDNMHHKESSETTQYSSFIKKRNPTINYLAPQQADSTHLESKQSSFNSLNYLKQQQQQQQNQEPSRKSSIDSNFSSVTRNQDMSEQLRIIENNLREHSSSSKTASKQETSSRINESKQQLVNEGTSIVEGGLYVASSSNDKNKILNIPITVVNSVKSESSLAKTNNDQTSIVSNQYDFFRHHDDLFTQLTENMHRRHEAFMQNARESMFNRDLFSIPVREGSNFASQSTQQFSSFSANSNGQVHASKDARSDFVYGNPVEVKYISESMSADSQKGNSYSKTEYSTANKKSDSSEQKSQNKLLNRQNLNQNYLKQEDNSSEKIIQESNKSVKQELLEVLNNYAQKIRSTSSISDKETLDIIETFVETLSTKSESQIQSLVVDNAIKSATSGYNSKAESYQQQQQCLNSSSAFKKFEKQQILNEEPKLSSEALQLLDYMMGAIKSKKGKSLVSSGVEPIVASSAGSMTGTTSYQQTQQMSSSSGYSSVQQHKSSNQAIQRVDNFTKSLKDSQ